MIINRNDAIAAEDMEARVTQFREHGNHFSGNLPFGEKHLENIVPEDGLQLFQLQGRGDAEQRAARNSDNGDTLGLRKTAQITSIVTSRCPP